MRYYKQDSLSVIARNQQIGEHFVQIAAILRLEGHE